MEGAAHTEVIMHIGYKALAQATAGVGRHQYSPSTEPVVPSGSAKSNSVLEFRRTFIELSTAPVRARSPNSPNTLGTIRGSF